MDKRPLLTRKQRHKLYQPPKRNCTAFDKGTFGMDSGLRHDYIGNRRDEMCGFLMSEFC
ncbi:hypothetical protein J2TS6_49390 [Paenibacillus albilobatus]|uniref:Uncharacterized protein n=1 Tax=Paenibacillus albilobatus TaxID=2716884 RepID=A0A919XPB8_9BACL|nr:hypothetical protein J2TS6_49390 [Paenibacillus albilobatus]